MMGILSTYLIQKSVILKSLLERTITFSRGNGMYKNLEGVQTVMNCLFLLLSYLLYACKIWVGIWPPYCPLTTRTSLVGLTHHQANLKPFLALRQVLQV